MIYRKVDHYSFIIIHSSFHYGGSTGNAKTGFMFRGIKSRKHPALPGMLSAALLFVKLVHELLADFQLLDDRAVALDIDFLEVIKQGFALTYQKNQ
jgi:hypothetical protein